MLRIELIDDNDEIHPEFERVLVEIFQRFDEDADSALSEAELDNLSNAASGKPVKFKIPLILV